MGLDTIPTRADGTTIAQDWFNVFKRVLAGDFVPRNGSGVVTANAGSLGSSTYPWLSIFLGAAASAISFVDSSGTLQIKVGASGGILSVNPAYLAYSIGGVEKFRVTSTGITRASLASFNYVISTSCGAFATSSGTFVDVTNLSVSLTTTGGAVQLELIDDGTGSGGSVYAGANATNSDATAHCEIGFLNNGTVLTTLLAGARGYISGADTCQNWEPGSSYSHLDLSVLGTPGTYTFSVQQRLTSGSQAQANYLQLIAREVF